MFPILSKAAVLFLLMAALSGCVGEAHDHDTHDHGEEAGMDDETHGPEHGANGTNGTAGSQPPMIVVKVVLNGTEVALENGSYAVPMGENVTFDASGSHDMDGGNVTFAWDFGDGEASTEAAPAFAWSSIGNYSVSLTVTDDENATANATFSMTVVSAGPAPGTVIREEKKQFKGTVTQPVAEAFCGDSPAGMDNLEFTWDITAAEPDGTATLVTKFTMAATAGPTNIDTDYYFYGPDGKEIASSSGFEPQTGPEKFTIEGEYGPGAYKLVVLSCASVNASITVDMTALYVAA